MPRQKRSDEAGVIYHALNRGNERKKIFRKDEDFKAFIRILFEGLERIDMLDTFSGQVFDEIKRASILRFGKDRCVDALLPLTRELDTRGVIISFDSETVSMAQTKGAKQTGWVVSAFDEQTLSVAADMRPDYLFVKRSRLDDRELPPNANWRWVVYDVTTQQQAQELFDRGVDLVETDFIGEFLANGDNNGG